MSFQSKPVHELVQIVANGGGLRLTATSRPQHELVQIAAAAKNGGAVVTFAGMLSRPQHELVQIATVGKGHVLFEG